MNDSTFGITPNATLEKILLSTEGVLTFTCRLDVGDGVAGNTIAGADNKYWSSVGDRVRCRGQTQYSSCPRWIYLPESPWDLGSVSTIETAISGRQ